MKLRESLTQPEDDFLRSDLDRVIRSGAIEMLTKVIEAEVADFVSSYANVVDENGRRQVVRNGYKPKRKVSTAVGTVDVKQPRVRDLRGQDHPESVRFTSKILPPYLRRSKPSKSSCHGSTFAASQAGTSKKPSLACLVRMQRACPHQQSRASRRSGRMSMLNGAGEIFRRKNTSTCGPTASTSTSA